MQQQPTHESKRTRKVTVRFHPHEYQKIQKQFEASTKRKLSEYLRSVLLQKPITFYTRNQSLDDTVAELIGLRNDLTKVEMILNRATEKLKIEPLDVQAGIWVRLLEKLSETWLQKTIEIKEQIAKISSLWLAK